MLHPGPYLTRHIAGIGGRIKVLPQDFAVDEILEGRGDENGRYTLALVEKWGRTTFEMISILATRLGLMEGAVRVAGMKDTAAVTRQHVSLEGVEPEKVMAIRCPNIRVIRVSRTDAPLSYGEHSRNAFAVRIRHADRSKAGQCLDALEILEGRGMPNFFGPQRFGSGDEGALAGRALVMEDDAGLVHALLAWHGGRSNCHAAQARRLFSSGQWEAALKRWPSRWYVKRRMIGALLQNHGDLGAAKAALPVKMKRLYLMGYQSHLFNLFLTARMDSFDRLLPGDLGCSRNQRFQLLEVDEDTVSDGIPGGPWAPTGPLFGPRMPRPAGKIRDVEDEIVRLEGLRSEALFSWAGPGRFLSGCRRPLQVRIEDLSLQWDGSDLCLRFALPPGAYATVLLGEIMKPSRRA